MLEQWCGLTVFQGVAGKVRMQVLSAQNQSEHAKARRMGRLKEGREGAQPKSLLSIAVACKGW